MKQESCEYLLGPVATLAECTDTGKWRNQRPVINDHCKCCQQCIPYCPCGVIQINKKRSVRKLIIDTVKVVLYALIYVNLMQ